MVTPTSHYPTQKPYSTKLLTVSQMCDYLYPNNEHYQEREMVEEYIKLLIRQGIDLRVLPSFLHEFIVSNNNTITKSKWISEDIHEIIIMRHMENRLCT